MPEDQVKIKKYSEMSEGLNCCSDGDYYPYGTSLSFENEMVDELNIGALAVGDVVEIRGYAFVDRKSEHSSKNHNTKDVSFQVTSLKVTRETDDVVTQLYGDQS